MNPIDELHTISEIQFYKQYFTKRPVLLKGSIVGTEYYKNWSFEHLKAKIGDRQVNIRYIETGIFNQDSVLIPLAFDTFIDRTIAPQASRAYYLQAIAIPQVFPELDEEMTRPPFIRDADIMSAPLLWVGTAGCVSPLHHDYDENFLVQVRGTKVITLFPPSDTPFLYQNTMPPVHLSAINNLEQVDPVTFPLFTQATPMYCKLCAGDILYIPPYWWHHVKTTEASISINYWFERFDVSDVSGVATKDVDTLTTTYQKYLDQGVSINHRDVEGELLLIKAIHLGYKNVVESMLRLGADPNSISTIRRPGASALTISHELGHAEIAALLLHYGAS